MARSLNQCNFIGNLGQDPETKYLPSGAAVTNISIGVSDDYKDKNTGQKVEQTEWVRVTAFGKLAEIIGEYCKKGSKVYVSGKMKTRKWQGQDGQDRYTTEIHANDLQMLDSRDSGAPSHNQSPQNNQHDYRGHGGSNQNNPTYQQPQQSAQNFDDFDSQVPF